MDRLKKSSSNRTRVLAEPSGGSEGQATILLRFKGITYLVAQPATLEAALDEAKRLFPTLDHSTAFLEKTLPSIGPVRIDWSSWTSELVQERSAGIPAVFEVKEGTAQTAKQGDQGTASADENGLTVQKKREHDQVDGEQASRVFEARKRADDGRHGSVKKRHTQSLLPLARKAVVSFEEVPLGSKVPVCLNGLDGKRHLLYHSLEETVADLKAAVKVLSGDTDGYLALIASGPTKPSKVKRPSVRFQSGRHPLPFEVVERITHHLPERQLKPVTLVSSAFYRAALPRLWSYIPLRFWRDAYNQAWTLPSTNTSDLMSFMRDRPHLFKEVRTLDITFTDIEFNTDASLDDFAQSLGLGHLWDEDKQSFTDLDKWELQIDKLGGDADAAVARVLASFQATRSITLLDPESMIQDFDSTLEVLAALPHLSYLRLRHDYFPFHPTTLLEYLTSAKKPKPFRALKSLIVECMPVDSRFAAWPFWHEDWAKAKKAMKKRKAVMRTRVWLRDGDVTGTQSSDWEERIRGYYHEQPILRTQDGRMLER
ncbi:hypothetical protein JCM10213_008109 [Rhodosporidiobolus nylandii]